MKLIGQGVSSCVIKPPYTCDSTRIPKNRISKILRHNKAVEEENKYKIIHSLDPKRIFSPKEVLRCGITRKPQDVLRDLRRINCKTFQKSPKNVSNLEQIIMTNHGSPLHKVNLGKFYTSKETCEKYVIREIQRLLYCGKTLRSNKLSHMDLHSGNLLVDPNNGKFTIIDFGELTEDRSVFSYVRDRSFTKRDYTQFPPELVIISTILANRNRELIARAIRNMNIETLRLLDHGYKTGRLSGELVRGLRSTEYLKMIVDVMDPSNFPSIARDNLYSIRCGALLSLHKLLKEGKSFKYVCALCFVTLDSYAIGKIIQMIFDKIIIQDPDFYYKSSLVVIHNKIRQLTFTNIQNRATAREVLIDINKEKHM